MGQLFDTTRHLVAEEKYVVGQHASDRLEEQSDVVKLATVHFFERG